ncbi:MAG: hypothetical protein LLG04_13590, partial [Parachlamydia sp.]|nr:hypothetical protein [Parachlamydia sp.]
EAHYNKLEFTLFTKKNHFQLTGFRQLVEELRKNPKGYPLKKITVQGSIPWLEGRTLANQELGHFRDALNPFKKRAPSERDIRDLACRLLFAPAVPDMVSYIETHATALLGVTPCFRLVPKSGQGEELCDGYEIHCVDFHNRRHRLTLFEGLAPPAKAYFQTLSLELNPQDRFEWKASSQAQRDARENVLRWVDLEDPSPDDWALHQAFQILGRRSASDQEEQRLLEKMAEASEKAGFVTFLKRSLQQAIRDCEMSPVQASAYILNVMLALPEWLLKQETGQIGDILNGSETSLGEAIGKGGVRLEVLKCILPLCLWRHPEAYPLPHGRGFKIWVELDGLPLLLKLSPAEALHGLSRLQPLLEEEEKIVQRIRAKPIFFIQAEGPISTIMASAKNEAAELASHADPYVKGFAKELLIISVASSLTSETFFSLLKALPDLLEGENNPEARKQITHLAMERLLAYFDQRLPLLKAAEFASCLTILSEWIQMSRAEMVQILSRSLSELGDPALGAAAAELRQFLKQSSQAVLESQIIPNGLQDMVVQRTSARKPEDILQLLQELSRAISETTDSAQDATLADWIDKAGAKAAPLLKAHPSLQQELFGLYRSANVSLFKRQDSLKAISTLLSFSNPEAFDLAVYMAKERLERPLPPASDPDPYDRLICELCKREEDAAYVNALEFFRNPAISKRMPPKRHEELEAMLIATRLAILSRKSAEALNSASFLEVKSFLSSSRPVALRQQCLKATMQYLACFFLQSEKQLESFRHAWEMLKEMEGVAFLLTVSKPLRNESLRSDNSWIYHWIKSEAIQATSFELSPAFFFRSFVAGFLSFMGERYRTGPLMQQTAQGLSQLGKTEIEQQFGDFKIEAQNVGDYAYALQALLEQIVKIRMERIEIQALLLGVGSSCLTTLLERQSGIDPQRFLSLLHDYAFWPMVTFPLLVGLHEHYLKSIVQRADERKLFRNDPVLRFQLHFLAGEPLKPVPVLQKQRFQAEIQIFLNKLQAAGCHAGKIRQFHVILRLAREFGQEYSFSQLLAVYFAGISQEQGWGRVKLMRQLCRDAVVQAKERALAMGLVMKDVEPMLLNLWLAILKENPQPPPEDKEDLFDTVGTYIGELMEIWEACPKPVVDCYRSVLFTLIDMRKNEIAAVEANTDPAKMAAFCRKFASEYEKWAGSKKVEQTGERLFEEWGEVCAKVRTHTDSRSFELASDEEKQNLLQCYVILVEMGIILMPSGGEVYRRTVERVFEVIESHRLHVSINEEQFYHLFWLLVQPTHKSIRLSAQEQRVRVETFKKWMKRLQAFKLDAINRACQHLLEGNLANEIFKADAESLEELKALLK